MSDYPADYPQAPRGSSLDIVFRAMHEHGFEFGDGQDWQCPVHSDVIPSCGITAGESKAVIVSCQQCIQRLESSALFKSSFAAALGIDPDLLDADPEGAPQSKVLNEGERQKIGATRKARARIGTTEATYIYNGEDGREVMRVDRMRDVETGKKFFRQLSATPEGWALGIREGTERPLYRLPYVRVNAEADDQLWLHFVEGEKSVEFLESLNLHATCVAGGANVTDAVLSAAVAGARGIEGVRIIADNDHSGYAFALRAARAFKALDPSPRVEVYRSATDSPGDDAVEHFAEHSYEELVRLTPQTLRKLADDTAGAPDEAPEIVVRSEPEGDPDDLDDDPNHWPGPTEPLQVAKVFRHRFYTENGVAMMYYWNETFYVWDRGLNRYREVESAAMRAEVYTVLGHGRYFKAYADKPGQWLNWQPDMGKVTSVIDALKATCHLSLDYVEGRWLDGTPGEGYVHFANGHLDVDSESFVEPSPKMFNLNALPFEYDSTAPFPREWNRFLKSIWPDKASRDLLQEWFGYVLSGETRKQKMLLMVGPTRSGKGTINTVLQNLMGPAACASPTLAGLASNFGLQPLIGKSLGTIADARFGGRTDQMKAVVERLLTITGEDATTVDRKNRTAWFGTLPTRLMILSNEVPRLVESSDALANRFLILEMTRSFKDNPDESLKDRLVAEYPGIIRWALVGLKRLREQGHFTPTEAAERVRDDLLVLGSPVRAFVAEKLAFVPHSDDAAVERKTVFNAYLEWAAENNVIPMNSISFGRELSSAFKGQFEPIQIRQGRVRVPGYRGIKVLK